jgi:hypothetical protein
MVPDFGNDARFVFCFPEIVSNTIMIAGCIRQQNGGD